MVELGRDLCGSFGPTPLPKQGHLQQAAQDLVQAGLVFPLLLFLLEAQIRCQDKSCDHTICPLVLGTGPLEVDGVPSLSHGKEAVSGQERLNT